MGVKIKPLKEGPPWPVPVEVELSCDVAKEFFCRGFEIKRMTDEDPYSAFIADGWKESPTGTFHCPACSGKT